MKEQILDRLLEIIDDYVWMDWEQEDLEQLANELYAFFVKMSIGRVKKT